MKVLKIKGGKIKIEKKKEQFYEGEKVASISKCGMVTTYFLGEKPPYKMKKVIEY